LIIWRLIGAPSRVHVVKHCNDYTTWATIAFKYLDFRSSREKSAAVLLNCGTCEFDVLAVALWMSNIDKTNNVCGHASPER